MNILQLQTYCLQKPGVTESFPFDTNVLVFKVLGKMFALTALSSWEKATPSINLKCNPDYAVELRDTYACIKPGFHMHKKHWNTIHLDTNEIRSSLLLKLIDHSYELVVENLPKKEQQKLLKT